ncbi:MAG TPA: autotransporter assembly complex family protein [Solimonas sp.]|nr:autotransporter assembly complex family protein [Solimonas sp.]
MKPRAVTILHACCALALAGWAVAASAGIEVQVSGLEDPEKENVELRLRIRTMAKSPDLDDLLVEGLHARAEDDIRAALQPYGYYSPVIESKLEGTAPDWKASYTVDKGPPTLITRIDVAVEGAGQGDRIFRRVFRRFPLTTWERLQHAEYEAAKTALSRAAYAEGYLDAVFATSEIRVNPEERSAEIELILDTGPRYFFGPVTVEQQILDEGVAERYVTIQPGQPFDPQQLLDTQFALTDLDYFQSVEIEPKRDQVKDAQVPVLVHTTPRPRRKWDLGVGYGTDTGARASIANEVRLLNRRGHKIRGELQVSEFKNSLSGEYRIPLGRKAGEYFGFGGASQTERYEDGESFKYSLNTALYRFPGHWKRKWYLIFEHEESELSDRVQTADLLMPGIELSRSELNDPIVPRRGWSLFTDAHGAQKGALASASFVQARSVLRGVYPYLRRGRLLGRVEYGANLVDDFDDLPASQRFFAGGDQSVRGYDYQSLGPRDDLGKVVGGKFLASGSLETDYFFWDQWGLAAFYDVGGADDNALPQLFHGVGVGARYRSPVGYIQVDLAHPLTGDDGGIKLHFGVRVGL